MILLDTNVISDILAKKKNNQVQSWLNAQEGPTLFISSIVIAELFFGAYLVKEEARREGLLQTIGRIRNEFAGRILWFVDTCAEVYGRITAVRQLAGRPIETKDAMIAAICIANDATLATRNVSDFGGLDLKIVNPFEAGG